MSASRVSYDSRKNSCVSSSITGMSRPSSETMCTSTDDCFCQEQVRQRPSPSSAYPQRRSSSAVMASTSTSGSDGALATEQDLLERVAAQAEPEGLERDHLVRRDVAEVDGRAEMLDEPRLARLRRRLPDDVVEVELVRDLVDPARAHVAALAEDPGRAALPRLRDHLPGTRLLLLAQPLHPLVGREDDVRVLRPDLGQDREVAREVLDQLELALPRDLDRAVRDLHVVDAEGREPALVLVELVLDVDGLEERAADDDGLALQHVELPLEVVGHVRRAPAELDDVDVLARRLEHV